MEQVVLTRIRELLVYRHWSRLHPNLLTGHSGQQIRREYTVELRALIKLAREARRQAEADTVWHLGRRPEQAAADRLFDPAGDSPDPVSDRDYHDWQAHGPVSDRESQPEFNGAFNRW